MGITLDFSNISVKIIMVFFRGGINMRYENITEGVFCERINRFTAVVKVNGSKEICHVKNTGRLKELLYEGAKVYVQHHHDSKRKTKYSLISTQKDGMFINIDSQAPNKVFYEWVKDGGFVQDVTLIKPEKTFGNSRFDCYIETKDRKIFVEVKGVTLKDGSTALFPDAPTERGVKHLYELCECVKQGYEAYIVFVIKMKGIECFSPNVRTHPEFADALKVCIENGVNVVCVDC